MIEIILATTNEDKVREINLIAQFSGVKFVKVEGFFRPEENAKTFFGNAQIKAKLAAQMMGKCALADDSGLCVDALGGRPGLNSARYAPTPQKKIEKILTEMKDVEHAFRSARYACAMALVGSKGEVLHFTNGFCDGEITFEPYGEGGFGYDPIFYVSKAKKTMAQMSDEEKNSMSHRALALLPMIEWIKENL